MLSCFKGRIIDKMNTNILDLRPKAVLICLNKASEIAVLLFTFGCQLNLTEEEDHDFSSRRQVPFCLDCLTKEQICTCRLPSSAGWLLASISKMLKGRHRRELSTTRTSTKLWQCECWEKKARGNFLGKQSHCSGCSGSHLFSCHELSCIIHGQWHWAITA